MSGNIMPMILGGLLSMLCIAVMVIVVLLNILLRIFFGDQK